MTPKLGPLLQQAERSDQLANRAQVASPGRQRDSWSTKGRAPVRIELGQAADSQRNGGSWVKRIGRKMNRRCPRYVRGSLGMTVGRRMRGPCRRQSISLSAKNAPLEAVKVPTKVLKVRSCLRRCLLALSKQWLNSFVARGVKHCLP
jgi:hypothetical protein